MKVKIAKQTLSESVACALEFCANDLNLDDFAGVKSTVYFLCQINNMFDISNSRNMLGVGWKSAIKP